MSLLSNSQKLYKRKTLAHLPILLILGNKPSPHKNGHQCISWTCVMKSFMNFYEVFYVKYHQSKAYPKFNTVTTTQKETVFICKEVWNRTTEQNQCVLIPLPTMWEGILSRLHPKVKKKKKLGSQKSNTIKVKLRNNLHWQQYHHFLFYRVKGF